MASKYDPLTETLRRAAVRRQDTVDLGFDDIAGLAGGLPPSVCHPAVVGEHTRTK